MSGLSLNDLQRDDAPTRLRRRREAALEGPGADLLDGDEDGLAAPLSSRSRLTSVPP